MSDLPFDQLSSQLAQSGPAAALQLTADTLKAQQKFHELFEARKMQVRCRLGLPLSGGDTDSLSEADRQKLEDGLIDACREVGGLLLKAGNVREGWMYLRPVGDKSETAQLLAGIEPTEDNTEDLIEILLHEGVDIGRGFALVLESYGTCSSITTYDQSIARRPRQEQAPAAVLLLKRLHADLVASVQSDIARQEGTQPKETTLRELIADREWLFHDNSYHVDTTHLASIVRIARVLAAPDDLRMALDLTEYGRQLSAQFQYQGDEPFADVYPSHALYYQALLGENIDAALAYFQQRAEMLDPQYHGLVAVEVYVDLLARIGRHADALDAAIRLSPAGAQSVGLAPSLLELAEKAGQYDAILTYCRNRNDLLGYTAALVQAGRGK